MPLLAVDYPSQSLLHFADGWAHLHCLLNKLDCKQVSNTLALDIAACLLNFYSLIAANLVQALQFLKSKLEFSSFSKEKMWSIIMILVETSCHSRRAFLMAMVDWHFGAGIVRRCVSIMCYWQKRCICTYSTCLQCFASSLITRRWLVDWYRLFGLEMQLTYALHTREVGWGRAGSWPEYTDAHQVNEPFAAHVLLLQNDLFTLPFTKENN